MSPVIGPRTLRDWLEAEGQNLHPDLSGGTELLRDNLASNQYFIDVDENSDAEGYPFEPPPEATAPTGFHYYATDVNRKSLRKQTGTPSSEGFDMTEPYLSEGTQPIGSAKIAVFGDYRPPAPLVVSVSGGRAGYESGERQLFITLVSRGGRHTLPSEGVTFSLTSGQGFRVDVPEGLSGGPRKLRIGWWLTEPGRGRASARLQKITRWGRVRESFAGPYRSGRKLPTENETELSAPPTIKVHNRTGGRAAANRMVFRAPGPGKLRAGDYRFSWAPVTAFGVARASQASDLVSVPEERELERPVSVDTVAGNDTLIPEIAGNKVGDALELRGNLPAPLVSGNTYFVVQVLEGGAIKVSASPGGAPVDLQAPNSTGRAYKVNILPYRKNESFRVRLPRQTRDVIGWLFFVQFNGTWYKLYRKGRLGSADSHLGFLRPQRVRIDGIFSEAPRQDSPSARRLAQAFAYTQENPPLENTSGIEEPQAAPEAPTTFQASTSLAATGKRRYAYSEVVEDGRGGERLSLPSPAVEHTTAAGQYARVIPLDPNNIFVNAEGIERGSDGVPLNMSVAGTNGVYRFGKDGIEEGKHVISTAGVSYADSTVVLDFDAREVNTSLTYCFRGDLEAEIVAGGTQVVLRQFDASGAFISNSNLRALDSSGAVGFETRFGPDGDQPWDASVVSVQLRLRMYGATQNMTVRAYNLAGHPYPMVPRKVQNNGANEPASFDPPPTTPFPRGVVWKVGPAPVTSYESQANEPLDDVDFTQSAALPPTGWFHNQNLASSSITTVAGTRVWQVKDATQSGSANASIYRDWTTQIAGSSLALRHVFEATSLPGGELNFLTYGRISGVDSAGTVLRLADLEVRTDGPLILAAFDRNNNEVRQHPGVRLSAGALLDYEIIVTGVGTRDGTLTLLTGLNGAERTVATQISGIDWRGLTALRTRAGAIAESNPATRWTLNTRRVVVTETGDAIGEAAAPPSGETASPPDRPPDGLGGFYSLDEDGETINQAYLFVPLYYSENRFDVDNVGRFAVIPGESYTFAIRSRHTVPTGDEGTLSWFLTLYNSQTGEELDIGSPVGEAAGISPWSDYPLSTGVIPAGFTEVRAHFRNVGPGLYLFQDIALSLGAVKRGYGVATSGWFRTVLDSRTPYEGACFRELTDGWASIGATADLPEGASLTPSYEHSDDLSLWSAFSPDDGLPESVYGAIRMDLAGDGRETPYVPPEGARIITRPARSLLLRADRSELPGGATLDGLEIPSTRSRFNVDEVGGHRLATSTTEAVTWTRPFIVEVYTEQAQREVEEKWNEGWAVEDPYLLDGAGALLVIRFADELTLTQEDIPREYKEGVRVVWARSEEVVAEVTEIIPLYVSGGSGA